jgi:cbb3-type cytochrome oxidase maturation protein
MSILFLILPLTLLLSGGAVMAFAWATRSGQFDDLETPALRVLHEGKLLTPLQRPPGPSTAGARPPGESSS